jgi:hypothetical protein
MRLVHIPSVLYKRVILIDTALLRSVRGRQFGPHGRLRPPQPDPSRRQRRGLGTKFLLVSLVCGGPVLTQSALEARP